MINQPINDGGSAFPSHPNHYSNGFYSTGEGMTLRDYFAAAALNGSLASQCKYSHWVFSNIPDDIKNDTGALSGIARLSYDLADAMLKAKEGLK